MKHRIQLSSSLTPVFKYGVPILMVFSLGFLFWYMIGYVDKLISVAFVILLGGLAIRQIVQFLQLRVLEFDGETAFVKSRNSIKTFSLSDIESIEGGKTVVLQLTLYHEISGMNKLTYLKRVSPLFDKLINRLDTDFRDELEKAHEDRLNSIVERGN